MATGLRSGGAISSGLTDTLTISACTFTGNQAIGGDGIGQPTSPITEGASASGGAIDSFQDPLIITGSVFKNNQAIGGNAVLSGTFSNGGVAGGGALSYDTLSSSVTASVSGSSFTGNQAIGGTGEGGGQGSGEGGAFDLGGPSTGASTFSISQTSITNNVARGGADPVTIFVRGFRWRGRDFQLVEHHNLGKHPDRKSGRRRNFQLERSGRYRPGWRARELLWNDDDLEHA